MLIFVSFPSTSVNVNVGVEKDAVSKQELVVVVRVDIFDVFVPIAFICVSVMLVIIVSPVSGVPVVEVVNFTTPVVPFRVNAVG